MRMNPFITPIYHVKPVTSCTECVVSLIKMFFSSTSFDKANKHLKFTTPVLGIWTLNDTNNSECWHTKSRELIGYWALCRSQWV